MTLRELTGFMSEVGKEFPDLVQDRNVSLFIDKVIERARQQSENSRSSIQRKVGIVQLGRQD